LQGVFRDHVSGYDEISTLPIALRTNLENAVPLLPFRVMQINISRSGDAIKAILILNDNAIIETIIISAKPGHWSACISSQVGCAMACAFCATGKQGFKRNLTADEIASQVLFWKQYLQKENISGSFANVVYMGMGESFANWDNVKRSIDALTDSNTFAFPKRGIAVSTSGIATGIKKFADSCPQINLAISLHFATNEKRSQYMPVNQGFDLDVLRNALQYYLAKNTRKVFIEYIMLDKINDTKSDAQALIRYLHSLQYPQLLHVNLIRYNDIGCNFSPSEPETVKKFKIAIEKAHIPCTIRKSVGEDVHGACGQLAGHAHCVKK
jgi:adenine C2-methylase RlmN of 23S rRNA A2503 and tRNA A37